MLALFKKILELISPQLREAIRGFLDDLEAKAKETDSVVDDIFVMFVKMLFGF